MIPKEKAKEIYDKFYGIPLYIKTIKQCCNIVIDEIIKSNHIWYENSIPYKYWIDVKNEIEKL